MKGTVQEREKVVRQRAAKRSWLFMKSPRVAKPARFPAMYALIRPEGRGLVAKIMFGPTANLAEIEAELDDLDEARREKLLEIRERYAD